MYVSFIPVEEDLRTDGNSSGCTFTHYFLPSYLYVRTCGTNQTMFSPKAACDQACLLMAWGWHHNELPTDAHNYMQVIYSYIASA